jgi:hypothetical protein
MDRERGMDVRRDILRSDAGISRDLFMRARLSIAVPVIRSRAQFLPLHHRRCVVMSTTIDTAREAVSERLNPALESLEQNVRDARSAMAHGRRVAEDFVGGATLRVRRHPLSSTALAVIAGMLAGCVLGFALGWQADHRSPQAR